MMEQRPLGATGLSVSALGFGAGAIGRDDLSERDVDQVLGAAVDAGVTLFDTARSYGRAEARLGRFLGARRAHVVLSTKGGYGVEGQPDWTGGCLRGGIERALLELRTDWIDVFHLHSCPADVAGRDDLLEALTAARRAGKIRVAGYAGDNEALAWAVDSGAFGAVECSLNLVDQANLPTIRRAVERGVGVIAKRPLANAVWGLTSEPTADDARAYFRRWRSVGTGDGAAQALRFAAYAPGVASAIAGCSRLEHLTANVGALSAGPLAAEDAARWTDAFRPYAGTWAAVI